MSLQLKTKSVYSPIRKQEDGLRILVTRFRGRGMAKTRYDLWLPNLGPTEQLLRNFLAEEISWLEFSRAYKRQLWASAEVDEENKTIKNHGQKGMLRMIKYLARRQPVTLLCHCHEDASQCHRFLLDEVIRSNKVTL